MDATLTVATPVAVVAQHQPHVAVIGGGNTKPVDGSIACLPEWARQPGMGSYRGPVAYVATRGQQPRKIQATQRGEPNWPTPLSSVLL